jgi:hypothetical protein
LVENLAKWATAAVAVHGKPVIVEISNGLGTRSMSAFTVSENRYNNQNNENVKKR